MTVLQVQFTNPSSSTVTLTSLTLTVSGTGNPVDMGPVTLLENGVPIATGILGSGAATFTINNTLGSNGNTYTVVTSFSTSASGTYIVSAVGAAGTNGQAVVVNGLPVTGAVVDVATPTATYTSTLVPKPTCVGPYPNPVENGPVSFHLWVPGTTVAKWSVFSLSLRKIVGGELTISNNGVIAWDLKDQYGKQVANGLYYVRVEMLGTQNLNKIFKVLIEK